LCHIDVSVLLTNFPICILAYFSKIEIKYTSIGSAHTTAAVISSRCHFEKFKPI